MKYIYPKNVLPSDIVHLSPLGRLIINNDGSANSRIGQVVDDGKLLQPHGAPVISLTCFNSVNAQYVSADDLRWEIDQDELEEIFNS